jgi:protein-tyrosine phosphatase
VHDGLLAEIELLPGGSLLPLAGGSYLLLELDRRAPTVDTADLVHELAVAGWRPVVAHPEHYPWLMADPQLLDRLVELGALYQVTAMSVTGAFGRRAQAASHLLLDRGLVHFVASDSHGTDFRPPGLKAAHATIAASWGRETAEALTSHNPAAVVENRPVPWPVPA